MISQFFKSSQFYLNSHRILINTNKYFPNIKSRDCEEKEIFKCTGSLCRVRRTIKPRKRDHHDEVVLLLSVV